MIFLLLRGTFVTFLFLMNLPPRFLRCTLRLVFFKIEGLLLAAFVFPRRYIIPVDTVGFRFFVQRVFLQVSQPQTIIC